MTIALSVIGIIVMLAGGYIAFRLLVKKAMGLLEHAIENEKVILAVSLFCWFLIAGLIATGIYSIVLFFSSFQ